MDVHLRRTKMKTTLKTLGESPSCSCFMPKAQVDAMIWKVEKHIFSKFVDFYDSKPPGSSNKQSIEASKCRYGFSSARSRCISAVPKLRWRFATTKKSMKCLVIDFKMLNSQIWWESFKELSTTYIDNYVFPIDILPTSVSFYLHTHTHLEYSKRNTLKTNF